MRRPQIVFRPEPEDLDVIDAEAAADGMTRSAVIRRAVRWYVHRNDTPSVPAVRPHSHSWVRDIKAGTRTCKVCGITP